MTVGRRGAVLIRALLAGTALSALSSLASAAGPASDPAAGAPAAAAIAPAVEVSPATPLSPVAAEAAPAEATPISEAAAPAEPEMPPPPADAATIATTPPTMAAPSAAPGAEPPTGALGTAPEADVAAPVTATVAPTAPEPPALRGSEPAPSPMPQAPAGATAPPVAPASDLATAPAPVPPVAAEPVPVVDPAVAALTEEIRKAATALDTRGSTLVAKDRAGVAAFYEARGYAPAWFDAAGATTTMADAVMRRLDRAREDGLDPAAYKVAPPQAGAPAADVAGAEIALSEAVVRFARHAQAGRVDPSAISSLLTPTRPFPEPLSALTEVVSASDPAARLDAFNPPHEGFQRLKARLIADLGAAIAEAPRALIPSGPSLKPGQRDTRVALLRERLGVPTASDADVYGEELVDAVKAFQRRRNITATGVLGPLTTAALNATEEKGAGVPDIVANMERWRWLPRDLGRRYVMVNVPEFMLAIKVDGETVHRTRVIVGKAQTQTPIFSGLMDHIIVNPYWNVPTSIFRKEMLGRAQATGGGYLARGNYEVVVGNRVVAPNAIDWSSVSPGSVRVRQRPGGANALGNIKFMFPNQHAVYLHDTPSRGLFQQTYRAFSHGCVRVDEPFAFADALLADETGIDGKRLKSMIGGSEKYTKLQFKIPVHIVYFTAWIDDQGQLQSRSDLYGHNKKVRAALGI